MRLHIHLASILSLAATGSAIFADDAFRVDYHHELVGQPQAHTTFFQKPYAGSKASLVYTLSDKFVLGAVNPRDGSLVWRQLLAVESPDAAEGFLRAGEGQDIVVSGVNSQVAAWSASDGRLVWESRFSGGAVQDLEILELPDGKEVPGTKDVIVLFTGSQSTLRRLKGGNGDVKWTFEDSSGDVPFQVSASSTSVYYISLHSPLLGGLKVKVTSLDPVTGKKMDQYTLSSESEISSPDSILFVGANSASPLLVWTDKSHKVLKINVIGNKNVISLNIDNPDNETIEEVTVHAPHSINALPHFLVHYQTASNHWAEVYHVDLKAAKIKKSYNVPKQAGRGAFTVSTSDANVFFTRITGEDMIVYSSASESAVESWSLSEHPLSGTSTIEPERLVSEVVPRSRGDASYAVRSAVLLSNSDWVLFQNGRFVWTRPESLAGAVNAVFMDLPDGEALAHELEIEVHGNVLSAYVHRVKRHLRDLEAFPSWIQNLPGRLVKSFSGTDDEVYTATKPDTFGLNKIIVVATENGRLIGLAAGQSGKILWSEKVVELQPAERWQDAQLDPFAKGIVRVSGGQLREELFLNTTSGQRIPPSDVPYRESKRTSSSHEESSGAVTVDIVDGSLQGSLKGKQEAGSIWQLSPGSGERLLKVVTKSEEGPIASIGKVLGDRSVLYKYLNPNVVLASTALDSTDSARVSLVDSVSGNVLYSATHSGVDLSRPLEATICENWFAYAFSMTASGSSSSRGHQLVSGELYESSIPNDRGPLGPSANYSSFQPSDSPADSGIPYVVSQSFHIPEEVSHMAVTRTRQGITSRQLLLTLPESRAVVGIPRTAIDPRRPVDRDPTGAEAAEGLVRYSPVLEFDPQWYLNHKREVLGVRKVLTSAALIESTSLVFVYGLDVFGTRVAPSFTFDVLGKDFNKIQMSATVAALAAGVMIVAPLVRRKQINARWQTS